MQRSRSWLEAFFLFFFFLFFFSLLTHLLFAEERFDNEKLERGMCEVLQDQMERFMDFYGNKFSNEQGLSFSNDLCPRAMKEPYFELWDKGMKEHVMFALKRNSRERQPLAKNLEEWGNRWVKMVARDSVNDPIEYVEIDDLTKRLAEHNEKKTEEL
jgi:hypothetical protein